MAAEPAPAHSDDGPPSPPTGSGREGKRAPGQPRTNPVELDRLIHGRVRLGIVSALAVHDVLGFVELRDLLDTSDGNLSVHARRLEDAGYLVCSKTFEARVPRTEYQLTDAGRRALERYLNHMEALIDRVRAD